MIEWYEHHGNRVAVMSDLKGKHREHCLCFECLKFYPDNEKWKGGSNLPGAEKKEKNCPIAQATFDNCEKHGLVTPVYECPKFDQALPF